MMSAIRILEIATWSPGSAVLVHGNAANLLEAGKVLLLPRLDFVLADAERSLLSPGVSDGRSKNVSYDATTRRLRGCALNGERRAALANMMQRYSLQARQLLDALLPGLETRLVNGLTSFRPVEIEGRLTSVNKDDTRLHVDAFASRPTGGLRILRVFSNINSGGNQRVWEIGEKFDSIAQRFRNYVAPQLPGSAWLLEKLHITRGRRSEYDHIMLCLHDAMKRDSEYQSTAPRVRAEFPAGSTWICFGDGVAHAALRGQYLLDQTFFLPVAAMHEQRYAPLCILEHIYKRKLA